MNLGIEDGNLLATMQVKPTILDRIKEAQGEDLQLQRLKDKVKAGRNIHFCNRRRWSIVPWKTYLRAKCRRNEEGDYARSTFCSLCYASRKHEDV